MTGWEGVVLQVLATVAAVGIVLWCFWVWVVRPHLDRKVAELIEATRDIEPQVVRGVKKGVADTLRELPENAWGGPVKESTRQFLKFGSGLFENGLSSFLGGTADMGQAPHRRPEEAKKSGQ
jgi:hypothetical protein